MNVLEKMESLQDALDNFKMELRSQCEGILRDAAKEVFDSVEGLEKFYCRGYPGFNDYYCRGYPPGFNDGVPCTWLSEGYWGNLSYEWCDYDKAYRLSDDGGVEQEPDFFESGLDDIYDQPTFNSAEECPQVEYVNSGVVDRGLANRKVGDMARLCGVVYDTNYAVYFTKRDDGSVDVFCEDDDCGY